MPFPPTSEPLAHAISERGYLEPTPVQNSVLEPETAARDLLVSAQTGSGKTIAYGLAIAPTILGEAERFQEADEPAALIVAPTRELAIQVATELTWLYARTNARIVTCVGGMDPRSEKRRLDAGAHIVVGTPGRLRDHLERGALRIGALRVLVLDEADEMLNLGFREDLEFLLEATPRERRTLLFSATLPKAIMAMAGRYQRNALRIEVKRDGSGHADIEYRAIRIAPAETEHAIVNVLRFTDAPSAIVFCKTREAVRHLHSNLVERGFSAVALSGELGQNERNQTMQALRDGRARVCVATDVAARGIDLPSLGLVIHADLPNDAETLQHRSGRTGRAGRKGVSVLLVPISRRRKAEGLLAQARVQATWGGAPSAEDIRRLDDERLAADPLLAEEPSEDEVAAAQTLLANRSPEAVAAALVRLYRARLPSPEDVFDPNYGADAKGGKRPFEERGGGEGPDERKSARDVPTVWFRMDVGRRNNADPKWILPLLCRRGKISRQEIGAIKIFDRETKFEIVRDVARRFATSAQQSDGDDITITPVDGPGDSADFSGGPARKRSFGKPAGKKPFHRRSADGKGGAPDGGRPKKPHKRRTEG